MTTVAAHYETHLAPVYVWMSGGVDAAFARGEAEIAALLPHLARGNLAVDLGAGFGMHSICLARRGCSVLAIDTCALLLEELRAHAAGLPRSRPGLVPMAGRPAESPRGPRRHRQNERHRPGFCLP